MSWAAIGVSAVGLIGSQLGKQKAPGAVALDTSRTDPSAIADETIAANQRLFEGGAPLVNQVNTFNQQEAMRLMEIAVPGFSRLSASLTQSAQSDLENQYNLPPEIEANLQRKAAEKGVSRGTSGGFEDFNLLRDFGFNLLDYSNAKRVSALNTLSTLTGLSPRVSPMSPMSMFFTPQSILASRTREAENQQAVAQGAENARVAADNYNRTALSEAAILAGTGVVTGVEDYFKRKKENEPSRIDSGAP